MPNRIGIISVAEEMPESTVSASELATQFGFELSRYTNELGFQSKHVATRDDEHPSDLCVRAAQKAISKAGISPDSIGTVIFAGSSKDYGAGWCCAIEVIRQLDLKNAKGFDLYLGCAGSLLSLDYARKSHDPEHPFTLIVSAERWHHTLSPTRNLFIGTTAHGDGAAACLAGPSEGNQILDLSSLTLPDLNGFIYIPAGGTREPASHHSIESGNHFRTRRFDMPVTEVYVKSYVHVINLAMSKNHISISQISQILMNQARMSMRTEICQKLGYPQSNCESTYEHYGHVGSADIFLTLNKFLERRNLNSPSLEGSFFVLAASNVSFYGAMPLLIHNQNFL